MENEEYNKVTFEELIIILREILQFLKRGANKNGKELANTPVPGD
jgi:hypothetical protein